LAILVNPTAICNILTLRYNPEIKPLLPIKTWKDFQPDNAVMLNDGTEDAVVCRHGAKVGLVTDGGKCHSVKLGSKDVKKKTQDDGYEILVDNSENERAEALASATDSMIS